jgi:hypothetical protein
MDDYTDRSRLYRLELEFYLTDEEYDKIAKDPKKFSMFLVNQLKHGNPTLKEV